MSIIDDVTKPKLYLEQRPLWLQTRAAIRGKNEVLKLVNEDGCLCAPMYRQATTSNGFATLNARQREYWSRGRFFNATGRTSDALDGMIWAEDPVVELPNKLKYMEVSADGFGTTLRDIVQGVTQEMINVGRYGALVDMPVSTGEPTIADQESGAKSPRIIGYMAEQIVFYRYAPESKKLAEVRLIETYHELVDDLDENGMAKYEQKEQLRRLVLEDGVYKNQVWRDEDMVSESIPRAAGREISAIPFYFFGADANTAEFGKIPMFDLASQNLGHFVLDCDNRDNLHYHGQGMTNVFTSMSPDEFASANPNGLDVGAKGKNQFAQGDKVEILQIESTGAIPAEMLRDEQRMVMLGAQVVQDVNSNATLGAKEMEFSSSTSTLKRISRNASIGVEWLLGIAAAFLNEAGDIKYRLNTDFVTNNMDAAMVGQHLAAIQQGSLARSTFGDTARKVGYTNDDNEKIAEDLENESMGVEPMSEDNAREQAAAEAAALENAE